MESSFRKYPERIGETSASLVPAEAGILGAAGVSAGEAVGAAALHVAAAHRL